MLMHCLLRQDVSPKNDDTPLGAYHRGSVASDLSNGNQSRVRTRHGFALAGFLLISVNHVCAFCFDFVRFCRLCLGKAVALVEIKKYEMPCTEENTSSFSFRRERKSELSANSACGRPCRRRIVQSYCRVDIVFEGSRGANSQESMSQGDTYML